MNVPVAAKLDAKLTGASPETERRLIAHEGLITRLARLGSIDLAAESPAGSVQLVIDETTVALPVARFIDVAAERARLEKEIQKSQAEIKKIDAKLANDAFVSKAPEAVIEEQRTRRADHRQTAEKLAAALERLKKAG
jgi:valyl-tRNA synthetase